MSFPEFPDSGDGSTRGHRPSPRKQLQGPRPTALKINQDSYKIKKPPIAPPPQPRPPPQNQSAPELLENRQPVIIYAVSPKIIHTTVSDFMSLVQRLTGTASSDPSTSGAGDLSPAARLASIETISPYKHREPAVDGNNDINFMDDFVGSGVEFVGGIQGILSPAPGSLPPIPAGLFSPTAVDPLSNMFILSPSTLFSAPLISPSPTSFDIFHPFFDF